MVIREPAFVAFVALVVAVAVQRLWEVRRSARNERAILARGGREHAPAQMRWMKAMHAGWLVAMPLEVVALGRDPVPALAVAACVVFAAGQVLRIAAMRTLGDRWTVKIMTLPGAPPVSGGIYRWVRHPNYLGVILEIAALPLVHGAWLTAVVFSVANALLLRARIAAEERALDEASGRYDAELGNRPRFVPRMT